MKRLLFTEEQKFEPRRLLIFTIVTIAVIAIPLGRGLYFLSADNSPGDNPMGVEGLVVSGVTLVVMAFIYTMLFKAKLKTKITTEKLSVSFPPLIRKWRDIDPDEIERYELREYHPNREYGGRGIKRRLRKGRAWTVAGRTGLQLYFKNGKRFLIGTQKQQALDHAMHKLMEKED